MAPARVRPAASLDEPALVDDGACLDSEDSALCALTDFQQHDPITIEIDRSMEDALAKMGKWGVHALLVTQQALGGRDLQVVGLITYYDIERRHRRHDTAAPEEIHGVIRVGEVMTAWDELALVDMSLCGPSPGVIFMRCFRVRG